LWQLIDDLCSPGPKIILPSCPRPHPDSPHPHKRTTPPVSTPLRSPLSPRGRLLYICAPPAHTVAAAAATARAPPSPRDAHLSRHPIPTHPSRTTITLISRPLVLACPPLPPHHETPANSCPCNHRRPPPISLLPMTSPSRRAPHPSHCTCSHAAGPVFAAIKHYWCAPHVPRRRPCHDRTFGRVHEMLRRGGLQCHSTRAADVRCRQREERWATRPGAEPDGQGSCHIRTPS